MVCIRCAGLGALIIGAIIFFVVSSRRRAKKQQARSAIASSEMALRGADHSTPEDDVAPAAG
jgi:hypothetical protein